MATPRPALLVLPSPELLPFIDSHLRPAIKDDYAEVAVGSSFEELAPVLARHDRVVIACGPTMPHLKQTMAEIVSKSSKARVVWIHSFSAGVDHLLTPEVKACGAPVTNAKGCFSQSLAEFVLCGCLHFDKEIPRLQANREAAKWERFQMGELAGQTIGIVGYGDIGQAIGRLAQAFQIKVLAHRRLETTGLSSDGVTMCIGEEGLDRLLCTSDFVVAALPSTPHTKHFFNGERLGKMKRTAVFLNVGRGSCVDEAALVLALSSHALKGACLDVYEVEPLPSDSSLWWLDNVLLSPHCADNTRTYYTSTVARFAELSGDFFVKEIPFPSLVDLEQGY